MSDVLSAYGRYKKKKGPKGVKYQVRYPTSETKSGYTYASFDTLKEARAFSENLGSLPKRPSAGVITIPEAVTRWLDICEKIGRDGREKVEPETFKEYRRRGRVIEEYAWTKNLPELEPADVVHFRNWLLQTKSRDLARRTLSSFHSIIIEMKHQGFIKDDPVARITISTSPLPMWSSARRNPARSDRAPLAVSRKTFSHPAA
jgi:integrase